MRRAKPRGVHELSPDELVAAAAGLGATERRALLAAWSARVALTVAGRDLVAAGIPPGPAIGRALARTREARESGRIGRGEELAFAVRTAHAILRTARA